MPIAIDPTITEAELLDAIANARIASVGGHSAALTTKEIREITGWGDRRLREALDWFKRAGRLVVDPVIRESVDGRQIRVQGYRLLAKPQPAEKAAPKATPKPAKRVTGRPQKKRKG